VPALDTERVLEILRRGQRTAAARRDRDTPAKGMPAPPQLPTTVPATGLAGPRRPDGGPEVAPADACRVSEEGGP
jgi:hypothetical protein